MANGSPFRYLSALHPTSLKHLSSHLATLVETRLWLKVLIGMFAGLLLGLLIGPTVGWVDPDTGNLIGNWLALPGQLFLAVIQMIVVPLVIASVIRGLAASENVDQLRKLGLRASAYFVATTGVAAFFGLGLAALLQPGRSLAGSLQASATNVQSGVETMAIPSASRPI